MDTRDTQTRIEAIREARAVLKRTVTGAAWIRLRTEAEGASEVGITALCATRVLPQPTFYPIRRGKST